MKAIAKIQPLYCSRIDKISSHIQPVNPFGFSFKGSFYRIVPAYQLCIVLLQVSMSEKLELVVVEYRENYKSINALKNAPPESVRR